MTRPSSIHAIHAQSEERLGTPWPHNPGCLFHADRYRAFARSLSGSQKPPRLTALREMGFIARNLVVCFEMQHPFCGPVRVPLGRPRPQGGNALLPETARSRMLGVFCLLGTGGFDFGVRVKHLLMDPQRHDAGDSNFPDDSVVDRV